MKFSDPSHALANLLLSNPCHMRNPKNPQRQNSLSVPHGADAFFTRAGARSPGIASETTPTHATVRPSKTLIAMKATNSHSRAKTSVNPAKSRATEPEGQLFLGHKVLGELRILMRLASPNTGSTESSESTGSRRSF